MDEMSQLSTAIDLIAAAEPPQKLLYSRKDAAYALSISVRSLDYLIANKKLVTRKLGKKICVPHSELTRFARADHLNSLASRSVFSKCLLPN